MELTCRFFGIIYNVNKEKKGNLSSSIKGKVPLFAMYLLNLDSSPSSDEIFLWCRCVDPLG